MSQENTPIFSFQERIRTENSSTPPTPVAEESRVVISNEEALPSLNHPLIEKRVMKFTLENVISKTERENLPKFSVGGSEFSVLYFPRGNANENREDASASLFLVCESVKDSDAVVCAHFMLSLVNVVDERVIVSKSATHRFHRDEVDWGFSKYCSLKKMFEGEEGEKKLVEDDKVDLYVHVAVYRDDYKTLWNDFATWDSKKMTGYVGLMNQGATCYMNSLLQSLYFTNAFRRAVYSIPTEVEEKSVPLSLQRVFYNLQNSDRAVGTKDLTRSFGWDTMDSFMQHDVQEFNRVLQDCLEEKIKKTPVEGLIEKLFVGKMKSFIKCVNVNYESSREEKFYDIQLNVKGMKNLEESFKDYIKVEMLNGENKYMAEGHGLQDAKKGVVFMEFPPVLHLQLKRFEYDFERDAMVKINDRHEFPLEIDLKEFKNEETENELYHLHGVLVHSGDVNGGHYMAYIRPTIENEWFKFDDDRVIKVSTEEALDENFGGEFNNKNRKIKKITNAYMLVYIKDSQRMEILKPITNKDIPLKLLELFENEKKLELEKRKEKEEILNSLNVYFITKKDLNEKISSDLFSTKPPIRFNKNFNFFQIIDHFQNIYNFNSNFRLWLFCKRQNNTFRPDSCITDFNQTLSQVGKNEILLYLEEDIKEGERELSIDDVLLFVKFYDPVEKKLNFVGSFVFKLSDKMENVILQVKHRIGLDETIPVRVYEEIKPTFIEQKALRGTIQSHELTTGDILIFQKELSFDLHKQSELDPLKQLTVPHHFDYLVNKVFVILKQKDLLDNQNDISIELSRKFSFDLVSEKVGAALSHDPTRILFHQFDPFYKNFKVISRRKNLCLNEMISVDNSSGLNYLFYEKLNISLMELESKISFQIILLDENLKESSIQKFLVSKNSLIKDLNLDFKNPRIYDTFNCRILREFKPNDPVSLFSTHSTIYAHEIPLDESLPNAKLVSVEHFNKDTSKMHGIPFKFPIFPNELCSQIKERIGKRLNISEKDLTRIKLARITFGSIQYLNPDEVLYNVEFGVNDHLGLDHVDRNATKSYDRSLKIHN
ncbi:cysteine proteinase [Rozella allomycis CSF55]|uniref:ubiquitinyl hydrolase 1 n=2 Tax=Rozella allomycis (strain CSF55) TaxID=988480 RepID=A0A4P9YNQ3_ROZAC|nr:cysteine proteinase [Rozella allomycis CSF55]